MCRVYLEDGVDDATPVDSDPVTISNSPPSVVGCSLSSNNPTTDEDVEAFSEGWWDDDGDAEGYIYEWYVNWELASSEPVLSSAMTQVGDNIYIELTAYDGVDEGNTVQSSYGTVASTP